MKTYISLSGFDTSQIVSLIVKYGIEGGDRLILIRPEDETDQRGEATVQAVTALSLQIDSSIDIQIHRVDHRNFEGMVTSMIDLLETAEGTVIANLSGGPRELFLAFAVACLAKSHKINKTTNYSDIDRVLREIELPSIAATVDEKLKRVLEDVSHHQPTTITDIARRLQISESTASRQVGRLFDLKAVDLRPRGKTKEVRITLTGRMLI
ncbi:MAG: CRISPR locus-related DNA-binding protein [Methanotrichaceae archaeon]|nr:CRISPR locus-related DNA-binding protein [Methanotrichaceae archaeon]